MAIEKKIYRSGPLKDFFAQGVQVGNVLYLAGQVGVDAAGKPGVDIIEQTKLVYLNIQQVLSEFGATLDNVVDETFFVTDMKELMDNAEPIFSARAKAYGKMPEVSQTLVQVSALVLPKLKLEIKCIAQV